MVQFLCYRSEASIPVKVVTPIVVFKQIYPSICPFESKCREVKIENTVLILRFRTDMPEMIVQTVIGLFLEGSALFLKKSSSASFGGNDVISIIRFNFYTDRSTPKK